MEEYYTTLTKKKKKKHTVKMTYRHYIQVYLIILHKYSSGNLYWPSLFSAFVAIHKGNQTRTEKMYMHTNWVIKDGEYATQLTYNEETISFTNAWIGLEHVWYYVWRWINYFNNPNQKVINYLECDYILYIM